MPTSGDTLPRRGEVWWVQLDKRRPALVIQTDAVRDPRVRTFLVAPMTSRLHLEGLPGNVRLSRSVTGLPRASVVNVYDIQKLFFGDLLERAGSLAAKNLDAVNAGLRLVLGL